MASDRVPERGRRWRLTESKAGPGCARLRCEGRPMTWLYCQLLWQSLLAGDGKIRLNLRTSRSWLSSADRDAVRSRGHDSVSVAIHSAQVPGIHGETDMLRAASGQVDAGGAAKRADRGVRRFRET